MGLARLVGSRGICHKASQKRLFGSNCDCKLHACVVARGKAVSETFLTGNLLGDTRGLLPPFRRRDEATRTEGRSNLSVTSRCSSLLSPFLCAFVLVLTCALLTTFSHCVQRVHNLDIDYMGQWNERDAPKAYNDALRLAVNTSSLSSTTTVLNRLPHYPGTAVEPDSKGCTQVGEKRCIFNIFYTESRRIMLTCVHTVHPLHAVRMEHNRRLAVGG